MKIKNLDELVLGWIWKMSKIKFESGVIPDDWRMAVIVPIYKSKTERTE